MVTEKPIDVDVPFNSRPELFPHPLRSLKMRRTVFVGEKVKILTGVREREQLIAGRWLVVGLLRRTDIECRLLRRQKKAFLLYSRKRSSLEPMRSSTPERSVSQSSELTRRRSRNSTLKSVNLLRSSYKPRRSAIASEL